MFNILHIIYMYVFEIVHIATFHKDLNVFWKTSYNLHCSSLLVLYKNFIIFQSKFAPSYETISCNTSRCLIQERHFFKYIWCRLGDKNKYFWKVLILFKYIFMTCRSIPMITFSRVETTCIYIIFLCPLAWVCVVYIVKKVASFPGLSQLMGMVRNRTHAPALLQQQEERKLLLRNWN